MDLDDTINASYAALDAFAKGDPAAVKLLFSHRDDVMLANPFGPAVAGWSAASQMLDFASSRFRNGHVSGVDRVARYEASDLAVIHETEHWHAKVAGREDLLAFDLRVTTTFRAEDGTWKIVHRHADPIATVSEDGPLRSVGREAAVDQ
jgi:ketosteroid isomerase-like protein